MPVRYKAALILIILTGIFTRTYHLGDKILWIDEGIEWRVASFQTVGEIIKYNRFEQHSPFPQIVSHYWIKTFGDSIAAIHAQSLLWSVLGLLFFAYLVFQYFPWEVSFGAVTVLSISAFVPEFAQMARYPSLGMFVAVLWWHGLLSYIKHGKTSSVILYGFAQILAVQTHLFAVLTVLSLILFQVIARKSFGRNIVPLIVADFVALLSIMPKYLLMKNMGIIAMAKKIPLLDVWSHIKTVPIGSVVRILVDFCVGRSNELETLSILLIGFILLVLFVVVIAVFFHKKFSFEGRLCFFLLAIPIFLGWMGMVFKGTYFHSQYFFQPYLAFCILLGIGTDRIRLWKPAIAPVFLVIYCVISLLCLHGYWSRINRPENIKTLLEYTAKNETQDDFLTISPPYIFNFNYYWKGKMPVYDFSDDHDPATTPHNNVFLITADEHQINEERMEQWHRDVASKYKRVWMFWVLGEKNTEDHIGFAKEWLDSHYEPIETRRYRMFPDRDGFSGLMVVYRVSDAH